MAGREETPPGDSRRYSAAVISESWCVLAKLQRLDVTQTLVSVVASKSKRDWLPKQILPQRP